MNSAAELLHRQLHAYSDSWRLDRGRDIPPWELEGWLEGGVSLFRLIRRLDEHLGTGASASGTGSAGGSDEEVGTLYADWLRGAAGPLERLNELEAQGCAVADAGEFRDVEREARSVLRVPLDAALGSGRYGDAAGATVPQIGEGMGQSLPA